MERAGAQVLNCPKQQSDTEGHWVHGRRGPSGHESWTNNCLFPCCKPESAGSVSNYLRGGGGGDTETTRNSKVRRRQEKAED